MDGLELRRALAEAAGWKWRKLGIPDEDEPDDVLYWAAVDDKKHRVYLREKMPLTWDDLMAVYEALCRRKPSVSGMDLELPTTPEHFADLILTQGFEFTSDWQARAAAYERAYSPRERRRL